LTSKRCHPKKADSKTAVAANPKKAGKKAAAAGSGGGGGVSNQENNKYGGWLVKQLKDELKARGLPVGGLKDALLERLEVNDKEIEGNGGVQVAKAEVDRRMTFVVNEKNRRETFTVDAKSAKSGKPKPGSKPSAKNAKTAAAIPEALPEEDEDQVVSSKQGISEDDEDEQAKPAKPSSKTIRLKAKIPEPLLEEEEDRSSQESQSEEESLNETMETVKKLPAAENRRGTFTVDTKTKPGKSTSKATTPEPLPEQEEDSTEEGELEDTQVITSGGQNKKESPKAKGLIENRVDYFEHLADQSHESAANESKASQTEEHEETVKAGTATTTTRHTYRIEGPDGVAREVHAATIDELISKMQILVVEEANDMAESGGVNDKTVDGASPVSLSDDSSSSIEPADTSDPELLTLTY